MPVIQPLAGSHTAPQQHKQPSRKGRKAWRKNVDVSEVERGLEERNSEIIKGGLVNEKQSADLFQIEDEGDLEVAKKLASKYKKGLKADEILAQRSAVPAVAGRKRAGDKTTDGVLAAKRQRKDYVTHKELVRLKQVADGHHASTITITEATYDPWAAHDTTTVAAHSTDGQFSFLPRAQKVKAPETLKQAPISLAANGKPVPAVAKPKGDLSYNPSFEVYEARFTEEGNKAVEAERKRLADAEAERIRMEGVARSAAEADEAAARALLSEWDEDSAWEGFQSGAENDDAGNAKRPKRKTPAQRNRVKRRKEAEAKVRHDAISVRKQEQAKNLEKLLAEEKFAREQALAVAAAGGSSDEDSGDEEVGDENVLRRRQLGKFRLPEKDLELVLPDELQESLRLLKPEGNLLKDRYRSLLVRGKVEARRNRPFRKQVKAKITEKWAHKDFHLF